MHASPIHTFRDMLALSRHSLDDALEIQAAVMEAISHRCAELKSIAESAKDDLATVEAALAIELKQDDAKISVNMLDAAVQRAPRRTLCWVTYQEARQEHEEWVGLLAAWTARGYNIKTLSDLYGAQYFQLDSTSPSIDDRRKWLRDAVNSASPPDPSLPRKRRSTA